MKFLPSFVFIFLTIHCFGQIQRNYTSYTVDNGLAQNSVWDAFQDHKGFMWFGTADGLNRFDGYKMYHYRPVNGDSTSIGGNNAYKFFEDKDKQLWISHDRGVSVYNRAKDCFKTVFVDSKTNSAIGDRYTTVMGEDKKGRVWCISGSFELIAIDKKSLNIVKTIKATDSKYRVSSIRTCISSGKYIIVYLNDSNTTWLRVNTESDEVTPIYGPAQITGNFIKYNDSTICTFDKNYLFLYSISQNKFSKKQIKQNEISKRINLLIATSAVWWQNKIYIGNPTGLYIFNPRTLTFEERITSFEKGEKIGFYYVQCLRVDRSGNLWICTNGDGAKCLSIYRNKFTHYNSYEAKNKLVKSITTDAAYNIYTGLYAEGIITYKNIGGLEQFKFGKSADELTHVLAQTFWNNRYFAVNDRLLKELDPATKKELNSSNVFHHKNHGYCAYPNFYHYKSKLFLSCDVALFEVEKNGKAKLLYKFKNLDTIISALSIINDTTWWIGTTKCIYIFNPNKNTWKKLPINLAVKTLCLTKDQKQVWAGGNTGLYLLNTEGKVIKRFEISPELPDDFVYGILEDNKGNMWMSHNKGISVYNPKTKLFKHYSVCIVLK